ncbi:MAG TPA: hypothetical protein VFT22_03835 [Kofleriaceae bacterium]|nr:hypothetical protein [Kofleriaceae bacterium]
MRRTILSAVLFAAAAAGGCYTSGSVGYTAGYSGEAYVATPDLVEVSPGVQVVADYDEPVFYTDGFYWRFYNGGWYRSNNYATGWYYYERPPVAVLRIDRPYAYAHYRPQGYVVRNRARYRPPEAIVRDHRQPEPVYRQPAPVVRDHRQPEPVYRQPEPVVRDHRQPEPVYRQPAPAPVVRDHRQPEPVSRPPTPAPAPVVRDHRQPEKRDERDERDHRH